MKNRAQGVVVVSAGVVLNMKTKIPELIFSANRRRGRLLRKYLLLPVCATFVGLLLGECLLRLAGISFPELYAPDPHCASRLRAGASGWWISEGRSFVRISSDGLRDREHDVTKRANVVRIAVLGDSFTEALQVDARDAYWAVAERELQRREKVDGRDFEFVNFGVSGYGTAQELLMLRSYVWKYEPDIVIVAFCQNDIKDNSKELGGGETRPYFVLQAEELHLDSSFLESDSYLTALTSYEQAKAWTVNRSYMLQVLKRAKMSWRLWRERTGDLDRGFEDMSSDFNIYAAPRTTAGTNAWRVTERMMIELRADVVKRNAKFGLMTVTTPLQVHPDSTVRNTATDNELTRNLLYAEHRLADLAERQGFPILTLATPFLEHAESGGVFLHGFPNTEPGTGHWNENGHRLAGQHLADWLENELLK